MLVFLLLLHCHSLLPRPPQFLPLSFPILASVSLFILSLGEDDPQNDPYVVKQELKKKMLESISTTSGPSSSILMMSLVKISLKL